MRDSERKFICENFIVGENFCVNKTWLKYFDLFTNIILFYVWQSIDFFSDHISNIFANGSKRDVKICESKSSSWSAIPFINDMDYGVFRSHCNSSIYYLRQAEDIGNPWNIGNCWESLYILLCCFSSDMDSIF